MRKLASAIVIFASLLTMPLAAQAEVLKGEEIEVELVSASANAVAGETLTLAVRLDPTEHWHTYSRWQGDSGDATALMDWELPAGAVPGELQFPTPTWLPFPGSDLVTFAYEEEIFLPVTVTVPEDYSADSFAASVYVQWQVCDDICILGEGRVGIELPVRGLSLETEPKWEQAFTNTLRACLWHRTSTIFSRCLRSAANALASLSSPMRPFSKARATSGSSRRASASSSPRLCAMSLLAPVWCRSPMNRLDAFAWRTTVSRAYWP